MDMALECCRTVHSLRPLNKSWHSVKSVLSSPCEGAVVVCPEDTDSNLLLWFKKKMKSVSYQPQTAVEQGVDTNDTNLTLNS